MKYRALRTGVDITLSFGDGDDVNSFRVVSFSLHNHRGQHKHLVDLNTAMGDRI